MNLLNVPGQHRAGEILRAAWRSGMLAHAYIFLGSPSAGGRELAASLAQALACSQPDENGGCGTCKSCLLIESLNHPDYTEVRTLKKKKQILIRQIVGERRKEKKKPNTEDYGDVIDEDVDKDETTPDISEEDDESSEATDVPIREKGLIDWINLAPYSARTKVAVIVDGDVIRTEAANALLKTIEEPPPHSLIILLVENLSNLLSTIVSRCQIVRLAPPPQDKLTATFVAGGLTAIQAQTLAWRNEIPEDAMVAWQILDNSRGAARAFLKVLGAGENSFSDALAEVGKERLEREVLKRIVEEMSWWLRDLCWLSSGGDTSKLANSDLEQELRSDFTKYQNKDLVEAWRHIAEALRSIDQNANLRLVMDELAIKLSHT